MNLKSTQTEAVKNWIASGANVSQVQKRLKDEFDVSMTYMDVRFLIDDIGAQIVEKSAPKAPEPTIAPEESAANDDFAEGTADFSDEPADEPQESPKGGSVQVSVSPIQRPDCIVSGDVVFSDASKAEWRIDKMGQLGIIPEPGKNPPQADMYEFQKKLQELLSRM